VISRSIPFGALTRLHIPALNGCHWQRLVALTGDGETALNSSRREMLSSCDNILGLGRSADEIWFNEKLRFGGAFCYQ